MNAATHRSARVRSIDYQWGREKEEIFKGMLCCMKGERTICSNKFCTKMVRSWAFSGACSSLLAIIAYVLVSYTVEDSYMR